MVNAPRHVPEVLHQEKTPSCKQKYCIHISEVARQALSVK